MTTRSSRRAFLGALVTTPVVMSALVAMPLKIVVVSPGDGLSMAIKIAHNSLYGKFGAR